MLRKINDFLSEMHLSLKKKMKDSSSRWNTAKKSRKRYSLELFDLEHETDVSEEFSPPNLT